LVHLVLPALKPEARDLDGFWIEIEIGIGNGLGLGWVGLVIVVGAGGTEAIRVVK